MSYQTNTDNIYPEGSFITAKEAQSIQLKIVRTDNESTTVLLLVMKDGDNWPTLSAN